MCPAGVVLICWLHIYKAHSHSNIPVMTNYENGNTVNAHSSALLFFRMQRVSLQTKYLENVAVKCSVSFNKEHCSCHHHWCVMQCSQSSVICCSRHSSPLDRKFFHFPSCFLNTMDLQKQAKHTVSFLA